MRVGDDWRIRGRGMRVVLTIVLCTALLAGCGAPKGAGTGAEAASAEAEPTEAKPAEAALAEAEPTEAKPAEAALAEAASAEVEPAKAEPVEGAEVVQEEAGDAEKPAGAEAAEPAGEKAGEQSFGIEGISENHEEWKLADFAPELCEAEATEERGTIAAGTEWENTVVVRRGAADGPSVYIIGGVHGDETAGWVAANLLKEVCPAAGTVYVLSPANVYGAANDRRTTRSDRDLNRNFPGDPEGWDAERIAASIFEDVKERKPDILLDLHETKGPQENAPERDDLRDSVIAYDVMPIGDLVFDLTVEGDLTLLGSPPVGSVNRTVSEELGIPAITLETWRGEALSERVAKQIRFVEQVLTFYGMR